jgi:patatin-like phospholipase/acyl hydrolase
MNGYWINLREAQNPDDIFSDIESNLNHIMEHGIPSYEGQPKITCDACWKDVGPCSRWHCVSCVDNYDECEECFARKNDSSNDLVHRHPHSMVQIPWGLFENINSCQRNLLCFDGGGIKGYVTILMFEEYMKKILLNVIDEFENDKSDSRKITQLLRFEEEDFKILESLKQQIKNNTDSEELSNMIDRLVKVFVPNKYHLVCGTSIGGIIALLFGLEVPFSKIKTTFVDRRDQIFPQHYKITNCWNYAKSFVWDGKPRYSNNGLIELYKELVGPIHFPDKNPKLITDDDLYSLTFKDLAFPCAVLCYDININTVVYFTSITEECQNIPILDAILSTSAAPTYFPSHSFVCDDYGYQCIDGGVWGNDPRMFAFCFDRILNTTQAWNIISFGTGLYYQKTYVNRKGKEDLISWGINSEPNIITTFMNASTSQVEKIFEFGFKTGLVRHAKLNVTFSQNIDLDDTKSLADQKNYFDTEKKEEKGNGITNFSKNLSDALIITWTMGTTEGANKKPFNAMINNNHRPTETERKNATKLKSSYWWNNLTAKKHQ